MAQNNNNNNNNKQNNKGSSTQNDPTPYPFLPTHPPHTPPLKKALLYVQLLDKTWLFLRVLTTGPRHK